jgi:1-acyl-sn-glycerol-3-phosphate acyltransferase
MPTNASPRLAEANGTRQAKNSAVSPEVRIRLDARDPAHIRRWWPRIRWSFDLWHRPTVAGIDNIPAEGPCLVVSNHSGGLMSLDAPILFDAFVRRFGYDRKAYLLTHDVVFHTPAAWELSKWGMIPAAPDAARAALAEGAVVLVFPGGDRDVYRPTTHGATIDFGGKTGYVKLAFDAGVPIVPVVSIGGQETQLFLSRGERIANLLQAPKWARIRVWPVALGVPFGPLYMLNAPLPVKISTRVLEPIDLGSGAPDDDTIATIDRDVRRRMQEALSQLARERKDPLLG